MRRVQTLGCLVLAATLLCSTALFAQDKTSDKSDKGGAAGADMQKMMADWAKYSTPGPEHALLKKLEGKWDTDWKMWSQPKAEPMSNKGTAENKMILGGHYLQLTTAGDMMGQKYEGSGTFGYDIFRGQYFMMLMDNMGTGMSMATGKSDKDSKVITMLGTIDDPTSNRKDVPIKYVYKFDNDNKYTVQEWAKAGTPDESMIFQMVCTRK